jgi:hypothetical protein
MTVTRKPDRRGARRRPLKPLRAGTPDEPVYPWVRHSCASPLPPGLRVHRSHPAFPTPSLGGRFSNTSGASRREDEVVSGIGGPSLRAKRSNPFFPSLCGEVNCFVACAPRNDGYATNSLVMPGLDPGIHQSSQQSFFRRRWITGAGPVMTISMGMAVSNLLLHRPFFAA